MQIQRTTELFEFIGRIGSIYDGNYLKLTLDSSTGLSGDPKCEFEVTTVYSGGKYTLMGNVTVVGNGRTITAPLPDVVVPFSTEDNLTSEVFKFVQTAYLLQRLVDRMSITKGEVKI